MSALSRAATRPAIHDIAALSGATGLGTTALRRTPRNTAPAPVPNVTSHRSLNAEPAQPQANSTIPALPDPHTAARAFGPVGLGTGALLQPPGVTEPPQVPAPSAIVSSTGLEPPGITSVPNLTGVPFQPDTRAALSDLLDSVASALSAPPWLRASFAGAEAKPPTGTTESGPNVDPTRIDECCNERG
ncbi:hypothetical protein [Nocardia sp. NPDC049149]|uniref:hypothetical protein n=1 Tax=Nocardia sp. NPDC049149 TaxID=3364315 RepID=UPI0037178EA3